MLDADDMYTENKLADQVAFLRLFPDMGLVGGSYYRIDDLGVVISEEAKPAGFIYPENEVIVNRFLVTETLIRRELVDAINGFDETKRIGEDWDFYSRLAIHGCPMYRIPNFVCMYRYHEGSASQDYDIQVHDKCDVVDKFLADSSLMEKLDKNYKKSRELYIKMRAYGNTYLKASLHAYINNREKGREYILKALAYDPELTNDHFKQTVGYVNSWLRVNNQSIPDLKEYILQIFRDLPGEVAGLCRIHARFLDSWVSKQLNTTYLNSRHSMAVAIRKRSMREAFHHYSECLKLDRKRTMADFINYFLGRRPGS